jgi:hypothetical protein
MICFPHEYCLDEAKRISYKSIVIYPLVFQPSLDQYSCNPLKYEYSSFYCRREYATFILVDVSLNGNQDTGV